MGREATITVDQVAAAADALRSEGKKPTSRAVRERLGNVGSMGTITKFMQRWRDEQQRGEAAALTLPPGLQRAILDFMGTELAAARQPLEAELADLKDAVDEVASENQTLERNVDGLREQLDQVASEKAAAEGKSSQLAADLDAAREEGARDRQAAETARTELAKAQLRLEAMPRLEADLEALRAELAKERSARVAAEQQAAVLTAQKVDLEGRLAEAKTNGQHTAEQLAQARTRVDELSTGLADSRLQAQTAKSHGDELAQQLKSAHAQLDQARTDAKAAIEAAAELRGRLSAAEAARAGEGGTSASKKR